MDFQLVSPKLKQKPKKEEPKPKKPKDPKEPTPPSVGTANGRESQRSEPLPPKTLLPSTSFYVQGGIQAGSLMAVTASVGVYLGGFNIEATYGSGMSKSETMYWNHDTDPSVASRECSYKPTLLGVRVGYGIAASRSLRLTPQVGLTAVNIKADGSKGNATSATIGLRTELALARHIALFADPEVGFAVSKSDIFSQVADVSSKVKGWASGFNVRAGISISF